MSRTRTNASACGDDVPVRHSTWVYQLLAVFFLGLRLIFDVSVNPMGDEAYYWIWGQHPQLSYLDHPPLHAWLLTLSSFVLGWSPFALRAFTWVTLAVSLWVIWLFADGTEPPNRPHQFWKAAAIYLSLPLTLVATTPAFHDHLLAALCLSAMYALGRFAKGLEMGQTRFQFFYLAAVLAGLAALTKYNGLLLAVGFAVFMIARPSLRPLWRSPHPYLAALIVAALQLPVLIWNANAGFPTLSLHFLARPEGHWAEPNLLGLFRYLIGMLLPLGPFLLAGFALLFLTPPRTLFSSVQRDLVLCVFIVSSLCFALASPFTDVLLHWNIVAYLAVATLAGAALQARWLLWPHFTLAIYLGTVFAWNYAVTPVRAPLFEDPGTAANYGWTEVAEAVRMVQAQHPDAFLATTRYTYTSQLAFQLQDPAVTALNPVLSQYDLWWDAEAHRGRDAIIVSDRQFTIGFVAERFADITRVATVPVYRQGKMIWQFDIYFAEGYGDPGPR